ncbi:Uma2 family endonuclease [Trichocoleus desertorum AS-A10]|uniref:Uma2 family endonuclease n=1 Tax=Trichocoleus desertorum TaxID=1481672 RepID=UPI003297A4CB
MGIYRWSSNSETNGGRQAWLIDPKERSVLVYQPDRLPGLLSGADLLSSLAGMALSLSVEQVFAWLRRR